MEMELTSDELSFSATPLTRFGLGAEITLLRKWLNRSSLRDTILNQMYSSGVILVRGLTLSNRELLRFAELFGAPEPILSAKQRVPGWPCIRLQSNVEGRGVSQSGQYWHTDGALRNPPTRLTFLYCDDAPASGGQTLFSDMGRAYNLLPGWAKKRVDESIGSFPCRTLALRALSHSQATEADRRRVLSSLRDLWLPLTRTHPATGRTTLFLNEEWLDRIDGDTDGKLLKTLYSVATARSNIYSHTWQVHDLLVWDNNATMHRAVPPADGSFKTTRRITITERIVDDVDLRRSRARTPR